MPLRRPLPPPRLPPSNAPIHQSDRRLRLRLPPRLRRARSPAWRLDRQIYTIVRSGPRDCRRPGLATGCVGILAHRNNDPHFEELCARLQQSYGLGSFTREERVWRRVQLGKFGEIERESAAEFAVEIE